MLNKLFKTENIKYIISVDDCFASPEEEQIRNELVIDSMFSFDKVASFFRKHGKEEQIDDIQEMLKITDANANALIQTLIDSIKIEEVVECLKFLHPDRDNVSEEQQGIVNFLNKLQTDGIIDKYVTIPSTHEAEAFDIKSHGMENGAILWLIDKNFSNAKESVTAGIELAKNKIQQATTSDNFIFMLTTIDGSSDDEEDIESKFDKMLLENGAEKTSFIYYINKNLIMNQKYDRIAKSLAYGFKRKQCYKLMEVFTNCLHTSCDKTIEKLFKIDQKTLNYVFAEKVQANGESYFEFFNRLVQIFHEDEYANILALNMLDISQNINHYQTLCESIPQGISDLTDIQNNLLAVRKKELYDIYVNQKHSEISTGDIFIIRDNYYILATQSCDTFLRKNGERKLKNAILLNIAEAPSTCYKYDLSCFCDKDNNFKHPAVTFRDNIVIPFEILDLCVTNDDGKSCIDISCFEEDCLLDTRYTINYSKRYKDILTLFSEVLKNKQIIDNFLSGNKSEKNTEEIKNAFSYLWNCDSAIKKFEFNGSSLSFPIQRIARLNELNTIDLLKEYGNMSSRVGHPFDFIKKKEKASDDK